MKILHLSTSDCAGGAARSAYRLHDGLRRIGEDSSLFVLHQKANAPHVREFYPAQNLLAQLRRRLRRFRIERDFRSYAPKRPAGLEAFTDDRTKYGGSVWKKLPDCDVINLHWTRGFLDLGTFFSQVSAPVIWTLHDMNAFTGGCHYSLGCVRFREQCGACPQLGSSDMKDLSRFIWRRKDKALRLMQAPLQVVTPSNWMSECVRSASLLGERPVTVIPYGLDTAIFAPFDQQAARQRFQIPSDARVVLFVADFLDNQRKGFSLLVDALNRVRIPNLVLVSMGRDRPQCALEARHIHLGMIHDDALLAEAYCAADLFAIPSLEDNLPNTVLESMACGTPAVGFDAGGIRDMVRADVTGLLAPPRDITALANIMSELLDDAARREAMSDQCRLVALEEYTLELQARRYRDLYQALLQGAPAD